jgi:hypothetical protein
MPCQNCKVTSTSIGTCDGSSRTTQYLYVAAENGGQDNDDDKDFPDYNGRVVSYNDPQSKRPGHGMVGDYIQDEKGYHVTFKYTDDLEPRDCVDHCPRHWIEESLVAVDAANAWKTAMENAKKLLGEDEDEGEEVEHTIERVETRYVLKCLITSCTSSSMFEALDYYPSALINSILQVDLKYRGVEVLKNKANLLLVCESFLIGFNLTLI